jgi:hypothetical protein
MDFRLGLHVTIAALASRLRRAEWGESEVEGRTFDWLSLRKQVELVRTSIRVCS